jgi:hypothetical protein
MMMNVEHSVEWELAWETEVLWENQPQCHFVHHKPHMTWARTWPPTVGSHRLTAWAMARPSRRLFVYVKTVLGSGNTLPWLQWHGWSRMGEGWNLGRVSGLTWTIILSRFGGDYRRGSDWRMDLLTTYTHHSELQVITALSLISILCQTLHAKSSPACSVFTSRFMVTALNSGDSSASVLTSLPSGEYSTAELST